MDRFLRETEVNQFVNHLSGGEQVVRNPRINAIISSQLKGLSPGASRLLATPEFTGSASREVIMWHSGEFQQEPRPLSELSGDERKHYEAILNRSLAEYANELRKAKPETQEIMRQVVTCHSPETVYCADDKVVLTEWGMHPKGQPTPNTLPLSFDVDPLPDKPADEKQPEPEKKQPEDERKQPEDGRKLSEPEKKQPEEGKKQPEEDKKQPEKKQPEEGRKQPEEDRTLKNPRNPRTPNPPAGDGYPGGGGGTGYPGGGGGTGYPGGGGGTGYPGGGGGGTGYPGGGGGSGDAGKRKNPWWKKLLKWLLGIIAALLLLLLLSMLLKNCKGGGDSGDPLKDIPRETPEITDDDISLSEDSLTNEVNNRVILLITEGGSVSDFVRDFRKVYPDKEKYKFANPDTVIPRIVLILPKDEKQEFVNSVGEKFPKYKLEVLPETLFNNSGTVSDDPELRDPKKRWYFDMCSVFDAWDTTMGSEDIVVAIIDDGFDLSHPEFQGKIVKPYNAVTHNDNVFPSKSGHGTHVAATAIGLANNREGTAGIAPNCKFMPIQVGDRNGNMSTSAVVDAVLYAIMQGANVVNMSLGMSFSEFMQFVPLPIQKNMRENNFLPEQRMWDKIFQMAADRNITFVIAGGNENVIIGLDPMQRSNKTIKVSAVQPDKTKASFSNYGDMSTLSAPGVEIYNAVPGGGYDFMQGTSMASPIVAGGVALLKSQDPSRTTDQIVNILRNTGIPSPSDVGPIVNFAKALNSQPGDEIGDCNEYQQRYNELMEELERLKREHPECIAEADTLVIPENPTVADLTGTWMSTTRLRNYDDQEIVIYFTFNGTPTGTVTYVEPDGGKYVAPIEVSISGDKINMRQTKEAEGPTGAYSPYTFVAVPDAERKATCSGVNQKNPSNKVNFMLVRLSK